MSTPKYIADFCKEVYPHSAELAMHMLSERTCITDATEMIRALKVERDALRNLFARRKLSDDKTILSDLGIAAVLLERHSGEIGFGIARNIKHFRDEALAALKEQP